VRKLKAMSCPEGGGCWRETGLRAQEQGTSSRTRREAGHRSAAAAPGAVQTVAPPSRDLPRVCRVVRVFFHEEKRRGEEEMGGEKNKTKGYVHNRWYGG
jgi:hypothetical protein